MNPGTHGGGAINHMAEQATARLEVANCRFLDNDAERGGAIMSLSGHAHVGSLPLLEGGAIHQEAPDGSFANLTLVGCESLSGDGAIHLDRDGLVGFGDLVILLTAYGG